MIVHIPYHNERTVNPPFLAGIAISLILKDEYELVHERDYTWHFDSKNKNLVISLNDEYKSLSSIIAMRFVGKDLYELGR